MVFLNLNKNLFLIADYNSIVQNAKLRNNSIQQGVYWFGECGGMHMREWCLEKLIDILWCMEFS